MADQNVNININEFDRTPQGETTTFGPEGGPPTGTGNAPNPNAHAPRQAPPTPPPAPEDPDSTTGQLQSLTGQLVNQAVIPIMETIFGRNPITGAAKTVMQTGLQLAGQAPELMSAASSLFGGGTAAGTAATGAAATAAADAATVAAGTAAGAAAATGATAGATATAGAGAGAAAVGTAGAAGGSALIPGIGVALAAVVVAVGAVTAAFLYAKDQLLAAGEEVQAYNGEIAAAFAMQRAQDVFNKINRANELSSEFSELTNLQTEANQIWSEIGNNFMKIVGPTLIDGLEMMNTILTVVKVHTDHLQKMHEFFADLYAKLPEWMKPVEVMNKHVKKIVNYLDVYKSPTAADQLDRADKLMDANLARVRAGQLPQNGGLGG